MIPLLLAGIILRVTHGWFDGQWLVGDILIWVGAVTTLLWVLVTAGLFAWIANQR